MLDDELLELDELVLELLDDELELLLDEALLELLEDALDDELDDPVLELDDDPLELLPALDELLLGVEELDDELDVPPPPLALLLDDPSGEVGRVVQPAARPAAITAAGAPESSSRNSRRLVRSAGSVAGLGPRRFDFGAM